MGDPQESDIPLLCPNCGYNLFGLPENRCPECGDPFDPDEVIARLPKPISRARALLLLFWPLGCILLTRGFAMLPLEEVFLRLAFLLFLVTVPGLVIAQIPLCWHLARRLRQTWCPCRRSGAAKDFLLFVGLYLVQLAMGLLVLWLIVLRPAVDALRSHPLV